MVMVGDRADTDGGFASTLGCRFALVLSGTTPDSDGVHADIVGADLAAVAERLLSNS
jgi:ribonucleotide monophosphatase NagD (HAD superfamily)